MKKLKWFVAIFLFSITIVHFVPLKKVNAASIDINSNDLYAINGRSQLAQISDADLINNVFTIVGTTVILKGKNNDITAYGGELFVLQASGNTNYIDQIHPDGSLTSYLFGSYPRKHALKSVAIDKNKNFVTFNDSNGKPIFQIISLEGEITEKKVTFRNPGDVNKLTLNGDAAVDGNNNFWKISYTDDGKKAYLQVFDIQGTEAIVKKTIELFDETGTIKMNFGSLAFLSDGNIVVAGVGSTYKVDLTTGRIHFIGSGFDAYDFASSHMPIFKTEPKVTLTADPKTDSNGTGSVYQRKEIEYTVKISNRGNLAASNSLLTQNALPENTEYVKGSTTLNGEAISDDNGQSPLTSGMLINSPGSAEGIVGNGNPATVTFKVKVNPSTPPGTLIENKGLTLNWEDAVEDVAELSSNALSHQVKENKTSLEAKDSTISLGSKWDPKDNFVSATDRDGNPLTYDASNIHVQGSVDTSQAGDYPLIYVNDDIEKKVTVHVVAALQFKDVPETLSFEQSEISINTKLIPREDPNWTIKIDNSAAKDWQVTAEATSVQDEDQNVYDNALIYKKENGEENDLTNGKQVIAAGISKEISPTIQWPKDQGVLFRCTPTKIKKGTYHATVIFTLEAVPS